jgi:hypothetical protein
LYSRICFRDINVVTLNHLAVLDLEEFVKLTLPARHLVEDVCSKPIVIAAQIELFVFAIRALAKATLGVATFTKTATAAMTTRRSLTNVCLLVDKITFIPPSEATGVLAK